MIYERSVMPILDHTVALDESDIEMTYIEDGSKVIITNTETGASLQMLSVDVLNAAQVILGDHLLQMKSA